MCIIGQTFQEQLPSMTWEYKWNVGLQSTDMRVIEGSGMSVAQHLSPHGFCINYGHFSSSFVCLFLRLVDELWQLTPEQPVKESACNETFTFWQRDSIIFSVKLFSSAAWLWQAQSACVRQITASVRFQRLLYAEHKRQWQVSGKGLIFKQFNCPKNSKRSTSSEITHWFEQEIIVYKRKMDPNRHFQRFEFIALYHGFW